MFKFSASAPGKLFLSGEYAVLEGAKAVITSVDRRITASTTKRNIPQTILVKEIKKQADSFLTQRADARIGILPNIEIENRGFSKDRVKFGIGSSAAVSAAATGTLLLWSGLPIKKYTKEIIQVATQAHRTYQGGKGSGGDVAASVSGGTIVFGGKGEIVNTGSPKAETIFVWTGKSASTVSFVQAVGDLKESESHLYDRIMARLVETSNTLAKGYLEGDAEAVVELTGEYADIMRDLGRAAQVPIMTEELELVCSLAKKCNGNAKPSGSGGGDMAVAVFIDPCETSKFKQN